MTIFIVGQINKQNKDRWAVKGVFDSEKEAKSHCNDWYDFYGPIELNKDLGEPFQKWPGLRYPIAEDYYRTNTEEVPEECRERFKNFMRK